MLKVDYISGCLKIVSNDFATNHQKVMEKVISIAQQEWSQFENWRPLNEPWKKYVVFSDYYNLGKKETQAFLKHSSMPKSFVSKFLQKIKKTHCEYFFRQLADILYCRNLHDGEYSLITALLTSQLYEVKCMICGKHYFIDEYNLCRVRRQSCSGARCLSTTLTNKVCTYDNLCDVGNNSDLLQLNIPTYLNKTISPSRSFYDGDSKLNIAYISDIHLLHQLNGSQNGDSIKTVINRIIRNLYSTMNHSDIIIFAGDTSSDANITVTFYKTFVKYKDYLTYKQDKDNLLMMKKMVSSLTETKLELENKIRKLNQHIEDLKHRVSEYFDFETIVDYKRQYRKQDSWSKTIEYYKHIPSHSTEIPIEAGGILDVLTQKLDLLTTYEFRYEKLVAKVKKTQNFFTHMETRYGKSIQNLSVQDIFTHHHLLSEDKHIFVILGNHEYMTFSTISAATTFYRNKLSPLGIHVLQNEHIELCIKNKKIILFGGTGFAKYNMKYNADTLACCSHFTRDIEVKESDMFASAYEKAKQIAKNENICFICASHYPINDCMNRIDNDTIYFYGHNHQNFYHKDENETIYADNQIGYKTFEITFKTMSTGVETNPYFYLSNGLYETTIKDYLQFYRYMGESVGDGALLYQRCQNDKASMYVIKQNGYYGFFIVNRHTGPAKGISIVDGGRTKRITTSIDLQWLFTNFGIVLSKYLQLLTPLRLAQESISNELQMLGLSGQIHGCIIDIDFFHHIMLNPVDGSVTCYYSPEFGIVQPLSSFENAILSMKEHNSKFGYSNKNYDLLLTDFHNKINQTTCWLNKITKSYLLDTSSTLVSEQDKEYIVSRSDGMYGISKKIAPLQRLFSCHVLRAFDLKLVEQQPSIQSNYKKRNKK